MYFLQPDPMMEALEAVVGDHDNLNGKLQAAEQDTEVYVVSLTIEQFYSFCNFIQFTKDTLDQYAMVVLVFR